MTDPIQFVEDRAIARLLRLLSVEGVTGREEAIAREVMTSLQEAGVGRRAMHFDEAHQKIPLPTQTGNLIVTLPGTRPGPRLLFSTHLDTVPLCAGAKPKRVGQRILAEGQTALGGDNRTGVAVLVTLAATVLERQLPHPPLTLLFTVREESGLWGARFVEKDALGNPAYCFNVDGRDPAELTIGAVGADRWEVEITGKAAHAGVHPERGISATAVASLALAEVYQGGWFGKVQQGDQTGTSNVGPFGGKEGRCAGDATNVVTDYVHIKGECRSHDTKFIGAITSAYKSAFKNAAGLVRDKHGKTAQIKFQARRDYFPFRLKESAPAVKHALAAAERIGLTAKLRHSNGGLDANWLTRNGIPTVSLGAGQNNIHSIGEYVDLRQFLDGCRLALALAVG
ncbi:MAG: M20/M25/M40 family metallo-hydrolase [Planctomycetia bacterium]|nr:M20/M25/M40 family metallo-hydrolase [Planctomycetia bacterium]